MKAVLIGVGVIGVGLGFGVLMAMSGSATSVEATDRSAVVAQTGFDYQAASISERKGWLSQQAEPMAKGFDRTLPKGTGDQPHMAVRGWAVDARRRAIEVQVQVKGQYGIDLRSLPAAKKAMIAQVCPSYATSALGANRVTLLHTFLGKDGREELSVEINPLVCRKYL